MMAAWFTNDFNRFFKDLAGNNNKEWFDAERKRYEASVKEPFTAFVAEVIVRIAKKDRSVAIGSKDAIFRINRDIRFSKDKTPYKLEASCVFEAENGLGWYMQISSNGLMVAGGWYQSTPAQVKRYREHLLEAGGDALRAALKPLPKAGFELGGDMLKTRPRGVDEDHPDIDLLRHRTMHVTKVWEPTAWMGTKKVQTNVRAAFEKMRPFIVTLADIVGPPE